VVGVRGRRGHGPVVGRGRRGEGAALRHQAPARCRRRGEAEGRGGLPALQLLLWLHGRPLGLHRQAGAQALHEAAGARVVVVLVRVCGSLTRRRRRSLLNAGVVTEVDDVKEGRVLVGALHLLRRRTSLRVPVSAAVVAPAMFARITSASGPESCLMGEKEEILLVHRRTRFAQSSITNPIWKLLYESLSPPTSDKEMKNKWRPAKHLQTTQSR